MRHYLFVFLLFVTLLFFASAAKSQGVEQPSRILELSAHVIAENSTATPITKYVYRITAPISGMPFQQTKAVRAEIEPVSLKPHKNGANQYFEFQTPIGPMRRVENTITFNVLTTAVDYFDQKLAAHRTDQHALLAPYLQPSSLIESDSSEVRAAAQSVFKTQTSPVDLARAAYEFPSKTLRFRLQERALGAQKALQRGEGDCTEHACLFIALCRTQSIPARRLNVFNFGANQQLSKTQPNHDIAEVYLPDTGWIPVDANLGRGRYDRAIGFGRLSNNMIAMNREGAWVYSTWLSPDSYSKQLPKPKVSLTLSWTGRVIAEGTGKELSRRFSRIRGTHLK